MLKSLTKFDNRMAEEMFESKYVISYHEYIPIYTFINNPQTFYYILTLSIIILIGC